MLDILIFFFKFLVDDTVSIGLALRAWKAAKILHHVIVFNITIGLLIRLMSFKVQRKNMAQVFEHLEEIFEHSAGNKIERVRWSILSVSLAIFYVKYQLPRYLTSNGIGTWNNFLKYLGLGYFVAPCRDKSLWSSRPTRRHKMCFSTQTTANGSSSQ